MSSKCELFHEGQVVVIERAMFRGRFTIEAFKRSDRRWYAKLAHESNPHENCHVLLSNLTAARGLIEPTYVPGQVWRDVMDGARLS